MLLASCSVDKYIPKNEFLLNKNIYVIEQDSLSEEEYKIVSSALSSAPEYAQQSPNNRLLGMRLGMRFYCLSNPDKDNWLNNIIRKQGSAPVIFDRASVDATALQLKLLLECPSALIHNYCKPAVNNEEYLPFVFGLNRCLHANHEFVYTLLSPIIVYATTKCGIDFYCILR